MGGRELQILFWSSRLVILFLFPLYITDMNLYREQADKLIFGGQWPYRDFHYEYPPLAYVLIAIPSLLQKWLGTDTTALYRLFFGFLLLPFDFLLFRSLLKFPPVRSAAFYYLFLTTCLSSLLFDRLDLLVAFAVAWPFLGRKTESDLKFAWAWGLGGALKLVPFVLVPLRLLPRLSKVRALWPSAVIPAVLAAFSLGLTAWVSGGNFAFLSHHSNRGVQVESIAGNLAITAIVMGWGGTATVQSNFGAQHVQGLDWLPVVAKEAFWGGLGVSLLILAWLSWRNRLDALRLTWMFLLSFLTWGYVLSPQFVLWLVPLLFPVLATLPVRRRKPFAFVFGAIVMLTGLHFYHYWSYVALKPLNVSLVLVRNLLLVSLCALSWRWLAFGKSEKT